MSAQWHDRCGHNVTAPAVAHDDARFCKQCGSVLRDGEPL